MSTRPSAPIAILVAFSVAVACRSVASAIVAPAGHIREQQPRARSCSLRLSQLTGNRTFLPWPCILGNFRWFPCKAAFCWSRLVFEKPGAPHAYLPPPCGVIRAWVLATSLLTPFDYEEAQVENEIG